MINFIPFFMSQIFGQEKKRFNHRATKVKFINNDVLKGETFLFNANGKSLHYSYFEFILCEFLNFPQGGQKGRDLVLNISFVHKGNSHRLFWKCLERY